MKEIPVMPERGIIDHAENGENEFALSTLQTSSEEVIR